MLAWQDIDCFTDHNTMKNDRSVKMIGLDNLDNVFKEKISCILNNNLNCVLWSYKTLFKRQLMTYMCHSYKYLYY